MALAHHPSMSVEDYLELDRSSIETRYEYIDGYVTMLAGRTLDHATIGANIISILRHLLRGSPCRVFTSDARVRLAKTRYVYPGASVSCDEQDRGQSDIVQSPRLVVEVLSPSTEAYDRGRKFSYYRECPAIQEYPHITLPDIKSSDWWIKNRDKPIDFIMSSVAVADISTPFTSQFPRYRRSDAIATIQALGDGFVVMDLETTGLKRGEDEIIEVSIVLYGTGEVLLDTLLKSDDMERYNKSQAKEVSKIGAEELEQAPSFGDLSEKISHIVSAYHVVTYNTNFDVPFLQYQYVKHGLRVPKIMATCAMRIFSAFMDTDTNMSLEYACRVLGIKQEQYGVSHRSLADVLVTIELLKNLLIREGVI